MDRRSNLPGSSSDKVTSIRGRRSSSPVQKAGQYDTAFFLLNSLQAIVDGIVGIRWVIAALILLFIGDPDLHDAIVKWALSQ